jgi:cell division protein FtsI/penicillin-binding protein 2
MGQEIAVTPLQLITAFCAILNDGVLLRPRVVRAVLSADGEVMEEHVGPGPVRRVLPIETARYLSKEVLAAVVNGGSGRRAALPNYQVVGKTGTAQVPYEDRRGYEPEAYVASFMGAAPADDPRVGVLVMIRKPDPRLGYYGGVVSAPAVRQILAETLAYLQVPPQTVGAGSQT